MGNSVASRLNSKFKIVSTSTAEATMLQLSGPIENQDELDALVEALEVMHEWLPTPPKEAMTKE